MPIISEARDVERFIRHKCVKSFLDLIILTSIKRREMSGYDVMTTVYDRYHVLLSPGTIYPILNSLKNKRMVQENRTNRKKIYTLTEQGRTYADILGEEYDKFYSQLRS